MRTLILPALLFAALPVWADDTPIGPEGAAALPLFDAHMHYSQPAWGDYPPATVIELMDNNGVAMALVSSSPDEGTIKLWEHAPGRFVPEVRPYRGQWGPGNWARDPDAFAYILERLDAYPHEGIGEFHIHRLNRQDEPLLRQIVKAAKERDLFIHIHSDKGPVDLLFWLEPASKIIWAHAGMSEPADVVEEMMAKYDTLYADTSYREYDILSREGGLNPDWERVLLRFPDRFMIGSDTWANEQWRIYDRLISENRRWLALLPRDVAEKIAYKNAERLFKRKIK